MSSKKFLKVVFALLVFGILSIGGVNYIVDPFQQYRVKTFYPIAFTNQRYQNAGLSKNFEYDSLILGTSMTENFILDEVEKKLNFNKLIKLSVSGGSAKEQSTTLKTAIENNDNLKNVLWGLDIFAFIGEPDRLRNGLDSFPFYLYDKNILNDNKYLLSTDTLKESFKAIIRPLVRKDEFLYNYNIMYQWQHKYEKEFSLEYIIKAWKNRETFINYEKEKQGIFYLKNSFEINFLNLIQDNPKINFKIFFPPYSILHFKIYEEINQVKDILEFKRYIYDNLLMFNNVEIYDFQSEKTITHNLGNYKDLSHYHQKINTWMIEEIKENNYLVTKDNIDEHLENLRKQIEEYDLNKILE